MSGTRRGPVEGVSGDAKQPAVLGGTPACGGGSRGGLGALPEPLDVLLRHPDEEHDGVDPGLDQVSGAADPGLQQAMLVLRYGGQRSAAPQPLRAAGRLGQGQGREPRVSPRPQLPQGVTRGEARPLRDKPPPAWTPGCRCHVPAGPGPRCIGGGGGGGGGG